MRHHPDPDREPRWGEHHGARLGWSAQCPRTVPSPGTGSFVDDDARRDFDDDDLEVVEDHDDFDDDDGFTDTGTHGGTQHQHRHAWRHQHRHDTGSGHD